MKKQLILLAAAVAAPVSAQTVPTQGGDASSVLGRDTGPSNEREARKRGRAPIPVTQQAPAVSNVVESGEVQIGAVFIDGLIELSQADFADIAEAYTGRTVDSAGLRELARAIADRARARGYIFASAAIPAQQLNIGVVRVILTEGAIDEVRINGSRNARVTALLQALQGPSARKAIVERQLLLAGDVPGIEIDKTRYVREDGKGVLLVDVEEEGYAGLVTLDNYGENSFGPVRLRLETDLNGILGSDDQLSTYVTLTPAQPRELTYVALRYADIISASGLEVALFGSAGRTHDADRASGYEAIGRSRSVSGSLSAPLKRSSVGSFWLSADFRYLEVDQDYANGDVQRDDIVTATVSGWGNLRTGKKSRLRGGVSVTQGLDIFDATEAFDLRASRFDGSGKFTKANAWVNWSGPLYGGLSMRLAASGQVANRPLLSAQEIGLGGPSYGRGYDFSERSGDRGVLGSAELRRTFDDPVKFLSWAQIYGFVDGGYIDNLRSGFGGGTLVSGGGGIRAGAGRAELGVEVAAPINADRFETNDRSPKVNLVLSYGF